MTHTTFEIPATMMRGGTSKGLYFLGQDLPDDVVQRDQLLLRAMGSPDERQIDGLGGAHPLTSKVAVVSKSTDAGADIDYLFLQVQVDKPLVSDGQNCGNILAGVGPFAIEQGLVEAQDGVTRIRIRMCNSGGIAVATVLTPNAQVIYEGDAVIDGVPGSAAPVLLDFADVAGATCGALLPTGNAVDRFEGVAVTCVDNGMPVCLLRAADLGKIGNETPAALEADDSLKSKLESIRLAAGRAMNLGDVTDKTVPKMSLVSAPLNGGVINTRTFIPHRVHQSIGVLGAASVAAACRVDGSVAADIAELPVSDRLRIEHPTGGFDVDIAIRNDAGHYRITKSALLRTARKLMQGTVFVSAEG